MHTTRLKLVLFLTPFISACAQERPERQETYVRSGAPAVQTLSVPFDAEGRSDRVRLRPDETFVVRLESRGGPEYGWQLTRDAAQQDVVDIVSEPRPVVSPAGASAAAEPKWDVFTFRALRPGSTTLRFNHVLRPKPDAPPTKRYEVAVKVESAS